MVKETIVKNLKGLEDLAGVPGTLGGALYMNVELMVLKFQIIFIWGNKYIEWERN